MDEILEEYTDPKKPGSFAGQSSFIREIKKRKTDVNEDLIKQTLSNKEVYTMHRPIRKSFKRNQVIVSGKNDTIQMDLVDMSSLAKTNDGTKFILTCIDVFSKYAWAIPLKNKSANSVLDGIKQVIKDQSPNRIQTDEGKEFLNNMVKQYLGRNSIKLYVLNSEMKASIVERFNRTLKERMWRYFTYHQTYRYLDHLKDFVDSYNNTYHRSIKMTPNQVTEENENIVFQNLYGFDKQTGPEASIKFKYQIGDLVRLSKSKAIFEKGYTAKWTRELFKIYERIPRIPPVYKVIDTHPTNPDIVKGIFYEEELQKVSNDDEVYYVEKVLRKRTKNGEKQEYVKWMGYPDKFNSWISTRDIVNSFENQDNVDIDKLENNSNRVQFSI